MSTNKVFGGNRVAQLSSETEGWSPFATGVYTYGIYRMAAGSRIQVPALESYTLFLLEVEPSTEVKVASEFGEKKVEVGEAIQGEKCAAEMVVTGGAATWLIAGTEKSQSDSSSVKLTPALEIKKVSKPWGHELWLNGEHPGYAFKQIFIKQGTKTSLQYHRLKKETNVLFEGAVYLHYKSNENVSNDAVSTLDVTQVKLDPVASIDVEPGTLHRLEALTDVLLYEVSTPHLDDVIRVSDDTARRDGRIVTEHVSTTR